MDGMRQAIHLLDTHEREFQQVPGLVVDNWLSTDAD
jgi:hypothetical protein